MIKATHCSLDGILLIEPLVYSDNRGFFLESFEKERYRELGIADEFIQDNHSRSARNILRGLHFTKKKPQAQVLTVMRGKIYDVVVDIRKDSPTYGEWLGIELSDEGPRQIYMTHGFAHGFCVLSDYADLHYKVSQRYDPNDEGGLAWNDPYIRINWPIKTPLVSEKDSLHPQLTEL
jgi:dTDP-4-dehydrorhamnose 3,5-epimerase